MTPYLNPATQQVYELLDARTTAVMSPEKFDTEITRLVTAGWTVTMISESVNQIIADTPFDKLAGALIFKLRRAADLGTKPKQKQTEPLIKRHTISAGVEYCNCTGQKIVHQRVASNELPAGHPWLIARQKFLTAPMLMRSEAW